MVATTTTSTRLATAPDTSFGAPVGADDWRIVVERLEGTGSVVGDCVVGSSPTGDAVVGTLGWVDLTYWVRGFETIRGGDEPFGRPRVGEMTLTLDNGDGRFTPWAQYSLTRPGTIIRVGLRSATDVRADGWLPVFCGVVDSWPPLFDGIRRGTAIDSTAAAWVDVLLVETASQLARIDANAVAVVGAGDTMATRTSRLLTAANWKFGLVSGDIVEDPGLPNLQSTDMAINRLTELYLAADSTGKVFRSDVTGAAITHGGPYAVSAFNNTTSRLEDFSTVASIPTLGLKPATEDVSGTRKHVVFDGDSIVLASDPTHILNDIRYARVGGTEQVRVNTVSAGRFGRFTQSRSDLICQTNAEALSLTQQTSLIRSRTSIRLDAVTVTATSRDEALLMCAAADVGTCKAYVYLDETADVYIIGVIRSVTHSVTPLAGRAHWITTFTVDAIDLVNFPDGAILDSSTA
jgi:hypothetical protein